MNGPSPRLRAVGEAFGLPGVMVDGVAWGSGHINDTFVATREAAGTRSRWVHQRINETVFRDPDAVMDNIVRVTEQVRRELEAEDAGEIERRVLRVVRTPDGEPLWRDADGAPWRTYPFIEGAAVADAPRGPDHAGEVAAAFGRFQRRLLGLPGPELAATIPGFHDTPARLAALTSAIETDARGRATGCAAEIDALLDRSELADALVRRAAAGELPERVTHNDTKINNVLIDESSGEGLCVIDLDTVMPGLVGWDFGDLVRTASSPAAEDERDLSRVRVDLEIFDALARGYLSTATFLRDPERETLVLSGLVMTYETAVRFLTDHLEGDRYFRTHRPDHNLDRARAQLALLSELERYRERMEAIVDAACREAGRGAS